MWHSIPKLTRDVSMAFLGAAGFLHELAVHQGAERPTIVLASLALLGLPAVIRTDEARSTRKTEERQADATAADDVLSAAAAEAVKVLAKAAAEAANVLAKDDAPDRQQ